nr:hypothetical protein [Gemmatimonadaceae bacterium]
MSRRVPTLLVTGALLAGATSAFAWAPPSTVSSTPTPDAAAAHEAFVARALRTAAAADSATTSFTVNGLRVIHRRVTANEVVAANLYLLGGTNHVPREKAGLEFVLLQASERGTRRYPRAVL